MKEMIDRRQIGKRLKELRNDKGKNLKEAANEMNIGASALANYENGFRIPRDEVKMVLSKYYGKSVQSIFYEV